MTVSINDTQHNWTLSITMLSIMIQCHFAECRILFTVMQSVIVQNDAECRGAMKTITYTYHTHTYHLHTYHTHTYHIHTYIIHTHISYAPIHTPTHRYTYTDTHTHIDTHKHTHTDTIVINSWYDRSYPIGRNLLQFKKKIQFIILFAAFCSFNMTSYIFYISNWLM
jgi:hypothetical protein